MSKLLFNTQPLVVDPDLAALLGLNEAIVLQQVHYWVELNKRSDRNYRGGYYWTYNSYPGWQEQFPFWSLETIKRTITGLEGKGLLVVGNFNELKIDRTKWYRIDYGVLDAMVDEAPPRLSISGNGRVKMTSPSGQNDLMHNHAGLGGVYLDDSRICEAINSPKKSRKRMN